MQMTKGERLVPEMLGEMPDKSKPILTENHPFLRKVIKFMESRREWQGTATELLKEIGDGYTPPNTVTKLLKRYDYDCFYKRDIVIQFHRTNRKWRLSVSSITGRKMTDIMTVTVTVSKNENGEIGVIYKRTVLSCPQG